MIAFEGPTRWHVPCSAIDRSMTEMAIDGSRGCEGIAMWLGRVDDHTALVTHVAVLRGKGIEKAANYIVIDADLVNELTDMVIDLRVMLLGQIHSHGPFYGTVLSETDRRCGISAPGYLSVVAPDYGMKPKTTIEDFGFHVFQNDAWRRMGGSEVQDRIVLSAEAEIPVVAVGHD